MGGVRGIRGPKSSYVVKLPPFQCSQSSWVAEPWVSLSRRIGSSWAATKNTQTQEQNRNGSRITSVSALTSGPPCASAMCLLEFPRSFFRVFSPAFLGRALGNWRCGIESQQGGRGLEGGGAGFHMSKVGPRLSRRGPRRLPRYRARQGQGEVGPGRGGAGRNGTERGSSFSELVNAVLGCRCIQIPPLGG